jgi:hypothetical protein
MNPRESNAAVKPDGREIVLECVFGAWTNPKAIASKGVAA